MRRPSSKITPTCGTIGVRTAQTLRGRDVPPKLSARVALHEPLGGSAGDTAGPASRTSSTSSKKRRRPDPGKGAVMRVGWPPDGAAAGHHHDESAHSLSESCTRLAVASSADLHLLPDGKLVSASKLDRFFEETGS